MCGVYAVFGRFSDADAQKYVQLANLVQGHRGPDSKGWETIELGGGRRALLGHQRLSILDLSDAGAQPMHSHDKRSTIIFNGEIYNYLELAQAHGIAPRSGSDTEVILELCDRIGPARAFAEANGMWAAVWVSPRDGKIAIVRDRAGKKPLYIFQDSNWLIVASELKTVAALSGRRFKINAQVLADYIDQGLQDASDESWLEGITSLPAGVAAEISPDGDGWRVDVSERWHPRELGETGSIEDATSRFRSLIHDSVNLRLRADVPVGVTLSGGLDSSIIAAELASILGDPMRVHAISAVAPGQSGDESIHVDRVCTALGINSLRVDLGRDPKAMLELAPRVTWHNDAPLSSISNIAFFQLMEVAGGEGIKVVLSGQGADEIFCGYRKYFLWALKEFASAGRPDKALANLVGSVVSRTVMSQLSLSEALRYLPGRKLQNESLLEIDIGSRTERRTIGLGKAGLAARQYADFRHFSVPYLTHYEDRASMAHGVEVRLPYLDYRLVEFGLGLPTDYKIRRGWTKYIMRRAFEGALPDKIVWRRDKQGFSNPQDDWLRGPLKPMFDAFYRSDASIYRQGLLNRERAIAMWERFTAGDKRIWGRSVFAPWALETWLTAFADYIES